MSAQRMTLEPRKIPAGAGRNPGRQLRLAVGLIVLAIPLSGCGTGALWDKFLAKDDTFVEEPADKLYNEGLFLMNQRKDPKAASKKFEEVDRQHPYSDWARKSLLMSAYAFYNAGDYDSCIGAATRYVTLHPGSPDAAYAQYLIAASHYDQIPDISRDQGRTEKAIAALEEVVRKYPTSEYAVSAKAKLEGARDQLAGREMNVGRYYMEKRDYTAAKTDIGWGHQIRSYVLQPYQLVKDLRTGVTSTSPSDVLDGDLDRFMAAALSQRVTGEKVDVEDVD